MSLLSPSMLTSTDSSMLADLSIDELRWLEASEILNFPSSTLSSASPSAAHDPQPAKQPPPTSSSSSTPPRTPPRWSSSAKPSIHGSPSEWIYRRPKAPSTSRGVPSTSTLPSTPSPPPPPRDASPLPVRSTASTKASNGNTELRHKSDDSASARKASSNSPFWSTILRPRSRSVRSIPHLKTIPSQSQVDLTDSLASSSVSGHYNSLPAAERDSASITISRRSPSISSTSSSTISSTTSSSRPTTPVSPVSLHPDPFGGFPNTSKGQHRRHASQPTPRDYNKLGPLSSSCPNKSILTRTSSISTKDSGATANKSVKFVEIPTVHYANAGYWGVDAVGRRMDVDDSSIDSMGINVDGMDMGARSARWGGSSHPNRTGFAGAHWGNSAVDCSNSSMHSCDEEDEEYSGSTRGLKRLMSLNRRSSVSSQQSYRRKSSASTLSTATITPATVKPLPPIPSSPRPTISGPYVLGSHPPASSSPAHSTASLKSTHRGPKARSLPAQGPYNPLEAYRSPKNSAARSVRSLGSVRSAESTASTPKLKSWLGRVALWGGAGQSPDA